jgi:predicted SAM-dependent methyltransferase
MTFLSWRRWTPQPIVDLRDAARFEIATAWGRLRQRPYTATDVDYLQVGSGQSRFPGFLNSGHFIDATAEYGLDIRYPLPFPDGRWVGIYAHHVVEHVDYQEALHFFRECRRVLRPGGRLRVAVPDVGRFATCYALPPEQRVASLRALLPDSHLASIEPPTAMGYMNYAVYSHPMNAHRSVWDRDTMQYALTLAGFEKIEFQACGRSPDPKLTGLDNQRWASQSLYVEAQRLA